MNREPNHKLISLMTEAGASNKGLAKRLRDLGAQRGAPLATTHVSVQRWRDGGGIRPDTALLLGEIMSTLLLRPVTLTDLGFAQEAPPSWKSPPPPPSGHQTSTDDMATGYVGRAARESDNSPRPAASQPLPRHYDCSPAELGCESPVLTAHTGPSARAVETARDTIDDPAGPSVTFEGRLDTARRLTDRTLAASSISSAQLDVLEERVSWASQQYVYTPPKPILGDLLELLDEVRSLATDRQPASVQTRLSEQTALLATLVADSLMKLGLLAKARAWYGTARTAADDSGLLEIRARVRAQAAMLPFYYGPIEAAVALTREAHLLTRSRPSATAAFAAAAQARALARLGNTRGAQEALQRATVTLERCDPGPEDHAFSFPERRLLLYQSGTYTALGLTSQARHAQEQALALYPARTGIDPTLLRLETAIGLARDHSAAEACQLAGSAYLQVAPHHRTTIVEQRTKEVITALPPAVRRTRAVKELHDLLALPPGQK